MSQGGSKLLKKLLILNGCVICLLDLEQCENLTDFFCMDDCVQPLPTIATLKLIQNELPVSGGLFKLGSAAYLIGGHDFPTDWKPSSMRRKDRCGGMLHKDRCGGYNLYTAYSSDNLLKGTSRATYRLSLTDDGSLIPSKGKMKKLKSPKFWPIVEEIDGQIHVFDSGPWLFHKADVDWVFSHEVLSCDGRWRKIPTNTGAPLGAFIKSHTVIDNCIYARTGHQKCLVFDAEKKVWEARKCKYDNLPNNFVLYATEVWEILAAGAARCAGTFPLISSESETLYVLIGVVSYPKYGEETSYPGVHAWAYLVTSMGQVVCRQPLDDFFEGPMVPCRMKTATMIKADEEGKAMCSIVSANAFVDGKELEHRFGREFLFVNIFTVEILSSSASRIRKHLEGGGGKGFGAFRPQEFVRVIVRDRYIFETDTHFKEIKDHDLTNELIHFPAIQACFI